MNATATLSHDFDIYDSTISGRIDRSRQVVADISLLSTAALAIDEVRADLTRRSAAHSDLGAYSLMTHRVLTRRRAVAEQQVAWESMYRLYGRACERFSDLALVPDDMVLRYNALRAKIAQIDAA